MSVPSPGDVLDTFKAHARIIHDRDDDLITDVYLPAAIGKLKAVTDLEDTDDWTGQPLLVMFRLAAAMYESREVNIDMAPMIPEIVSLWKPSA